MTRSTVRLAHTVPRLPNPLRAARRLIRGPPYCSTGQVICDLRRGQRAISMEPDGGLAALHHRGRRPETRRGPTLGGLWPPCCSTDPRRERLPTRLLLANGRSRCHRTRTIMLWVPVLRQTDASARPRSSDDPHHLAVCGVGARFSRTSTKGERRVHPLVGGH